MPKKSKERLQEESTMRKNFAKRLKLAKATRKLSNLDIVEISQKLGKPMSSSTVSQYFCGRFMPTDERTSLWGDILNVNPYWLMGFGSEDRVVDKLTKDYETRALKELQELFLRMNPRQQVLLIQVAKAFLDDTIQTILPDELKDEWLLYD